jgi:hypothetical protein
MECEDEKNDLLVDAERRSLCMVLNHSLIEFTLTFPQICQENDYKYKCPGCSVLTCSCSCVKAHKAKVQHQWKEKMVYSSILTIPHRLAVLDNVIALPLFQFNHLAIHN